MNAAGSALPAAVALRKLPLATSMQRRRASSSRALRRAPGPAGSARDRMATRASESAPVGGTRSHRSDRGTLTTEVAAKSGRATRQTHSAPHASPAQWQACPAPPGWSKGAFMTTTAPLQEPSSSPSSDSATAAHAGIQTAALRPALSPELSRSAPYHGCAVPLANWTACWRAPTAASASADAASTLALTWASETPWASALQSAGTAAREPAMRSRSLLQLEQHGQPLKAPLASLQAGFVLVPVLRTAAVPGEKMCAPRRHWFQAAGSAGGLQRAIEFPQPSTKTWKLFGVRYGFHLSYR